MEDWETSSRRDSILALHGGASHATAKVRTLKNPEALRDDGSIEQRELNTTRSVAELVLRVASAVMLISLCLQAIHR